MNDMPQTGRAADDTPVARSANVEPDTASPYARYALGVLTLVYVFNFVDRQILSILNEAIKADLGLTAVVAIPAALVVYTVADVTLAYAANVLFTAASSLWIGSAIVLSNELVLPRMRATTSAIYLLPVTFIGLALGPFTVGRINTSLTAAGASAGEALQSALLYGLAGYGVAVLCFALALRSLTVDEASRDARARALGAMT